MSSDDNGTTKGSAWWQIWRRFKKKRLQLPEATVNHPTGPVDWFKSLDQLQPVIRSMRNEIDELQTTKISFDMLGAGTFLLQIDLLLIKLRQHYNNYQRRQQELNLSIPQVKQIMDKVQYQCQLCCLIMQNLHILFRQLSADQINHPKVIEEVQQLEDATKSLTHSMQGLNEIALKRDPVYQLFENELFKTLMELEQSQPMGLGHPSSPSVTGPMRDKAHQILDSDFRKIAYNIISYFDTLKRCSILYQSSQVSDALESFKLHLEMYVDNAMLTPKQAAMQESLHGLFFDLEGMRFIRFKGFQDKSKSIKKQLTTLLNSSEFGRECLKSLQMSPRAKLKLKSRFNRSS